MNPRRDVLIFASAAIAWSVVLAAFFWWLPKKGYNPADALITIPAASVILAARGASWKRRIIYGLTIIGTFLLVDVWFLTSGRMHTAFVGLAQGETVASVTAVIYLIFAQGFPFLILVLFVGKDPSVLWSKASNRPQESSKRSGRA